MSEPNNNSTGTDRRKDPRIPMIAGSIILGVILIFLVVMYFDQRSKMREMETVLTHEKDSLANELMKMVHGYDTLRSNNDTLNANLAKEKDRIVKLLSINANNSVLIKRYRTEIGTMRDIMKNYIVQLDSLNSRNKLLSAENTEIRQQISQVRSTNTELSKAREQLNQKVEIASVIQAKDIIAVPLNRNRKETSRLSLLDKLRICFTLRENPIAQAGPKEVFVRVIRPDSLLITSSPDNVFTYRENKLIYTSTRTADYMNEDIEMCIFVDNSGDFVVGNYSVELYLDNNIIGRSTFIIPRK